MWRADVLFSGRAGELGLHLVGADLHPLAVQLTEKELVVTVTWQDGAHTVAGANRALRGRLRRIATPTMLAIEGVERLG